MYYDLLFMERCFSSSSLTLSPHLQTTYYVADENMSLKPDHKEGVIDVSVKGSQLTRDLVDATGNAPKQLEVICPISCDVGMDLLHPPANAVKWKIVLVDGEKVTNKDKETKQPHEYPGAMVFFFLTVGGKDTAVKAARLFHSKSKYAMYQPRFAVNPSKRVVVAVV